MKTFFPPFVAFVVFGLIVVLHSFIHPMYIGDMGRGDLHAFMACFYYCWPLYFICALLTQNVIAVPVWEAAEHWPTIGKDSMITVAFIVCAVFAGGVAYAIWDNKSTDFQLVWPASIMLIVQLAYWIMNFFVLFLYSGGKMPALHKPHAAAE